ncbi:hypothetical protein KFE25_003159 [Diacronema lutheri]|uniref:Uncharacterized protein n=1 Tax=Diacronema lutheri TaxID=2081491 RepID=A0A8J5XF71_DIALT|nr:hypothetical protein KFE25_003159 [Diacronema lutheri]
MASERRVHGFLLVGCCVVAAMCVGWAVAPTWVSERMSVEEMQASMLKTMLIDPWDRDKSGELNQAEYAEMSKNGGQRLSAEALRAEFSAKDANHDGQVSAREYAAFNAAEIASDTPDAHVRASVGSDHVHARGGTRVSARAEHSTHERSRSAHTHPVGARASRGAGSSEAGRAPHAAAHLHAHESTPAREHRAHVGVQRAEHAVHNSSDEVHRHGADEVEHAAHAPTHHLPHAAHNGSVGRASHPPHALGHHEPSGLGSNKSTAPQHRHTLAEHARRPSGSSPALPSAAGRTRRSGRAHGAHADAAAADASAGITIYPEGSE